ncbi:endoribonuclease rege-1-like [Maniola jurtina]|uniref:endoribonuclease rege-1-like n=1 Tax=Maniola jurtina TaxID=191418 RepID=UPI001E68B87B|nr:endoribonuclease rege-1-like [Maniola jurtina]
MGKNSKQRNRSKNAHATKVQKNNKILRKKSSKTNKNIKVLFDRLRNGSDSSSPSCSNNTVIELDCSEIKQDKQNLTSSFFIGDGEDGNLIINNAPCPEQCSTPLSSKHNSKMESPLRTNNNSNSIQNFQQEVEDLTREINRDSYLTIDLTNDTTLNTTNPQTTVIDLANTTDNHTVSNTNLSMSGDSDVTVVNVGRRKDRVNSTQMKKFLNAIANMDSSQKGTLLDLMAQRIFNGCNGTSSKTSLPSLKTGAARAPESAEDTYIKQVILGRQVSRNSIGSNIYNPERDIRNKTGLRMIVIDGSNVAMQHSRGRVFSVKGLKICIEYFVQRGHAVKAFVPQFRCKAGKSTDGKLLSQLERQGLVVFTPSREIQGRLINSYDDRYIVQCAAEFDGVIVSGDNYRDLLLENPRWRHVIENRLLQFTWVGDMIMFPRDPLGRNGPTLEQFLRHSPTV